MAPVKPARRTAADCERREYSSRLDVLRRVAVDYAETPGLCLTVAQAQRLFGLRRDICERVLNALVSDGALRQNGDGQFVRNCGRP